RCVGDDKGGLGALSFDQRVDGDGRAVDQLGDGGWLEPALADAVDDALFQLRRGSQALRLDEALGGIVEPDQIGEGTSDIDGDDDHAWPLYLTVLSSVRPRRSRPWIPACAGNDRSLVAGRAVAGINPGFRIRSSGFTSTRDEICVVRDCRIAPAIGRRQKIRDSRGKGKHFRERKECGRGWRLRW